MAVEATAPGFSRCCTRLASRLARCRSTSSAGKLGRLATSARALRELEAVHGSLIAAHLEKDLKSARVLRELRGH